MKTTQLFSFRRIAGISLLLPVAAFGQQDLNHFKTLESKGEIPADFAVLTSQKVADDIGRHESGFTGLKEKEFCEGVHYSIEPILHSGNVIYGDDITLYVREVADKLLEKDPELRKKLRFYTVKANTTNALSTDQGIIFLTTGLIAQLSSEAQLAYVLSHEIAHYTEKHVRESFTFRSGGGTSQRIERLSAHSHEQEFTADRLGMKLYNEAGYSADELVPGFDVLIYSYLPFDEVKIPKTYFQTAEMYIPDSFFATKEYAIKAEEDYDDNRSSHPNIKKRKYAVASEIGTYPNWGEAIFLLGRERFEYIRDLARFETIRTDILETDYAGSLYSIFLLEEKYPESVYLQQMKAQAWLGLMQFKSSLKINKILPRSSDYEGEIAALYYFLNKQSSQGMTTLAIRAIYDAQRRFPQDPQLKAIRSSLARGLASMESFKWSDYSDKNFHESASAALAKPDSAAVDTKSTDEVRSKYDRIRAKKSVAAPENFDSLKFYAYALPDILRDSVFLSEYEKYKAEKLTADRPDFRTIRKKDLPYFMLHGIALKKVIFIQPAASYAMKDKVYWTKADGYKQKAGESIAVAAGKEQVELIAVDQKHFGETGTEGYNRRSTLYTLLEQVAGNPTGMFVSVDYEYVEELRSFFGTDEVLFTSVDYNSGASPQTSMTTLLINLGSGDIQASVLQNKGLPKTASFPTVYTRIFSILKTLPQEYP